MMMARSSTSNPLLTMDHQNGIVGSTSAPMRATISYAPQTVLSASSRTIRSPNPTLSSSPTSMPVRTIASPLGTTATTGISNPVTSLLSLRDRGAKTGLLSPNTSSHDQFMSAVGGADLSSLALDLAQKRSHEERSTSSSSSINLDNTLAPHSPERKLPFLDFRPDNCSTGIHDADDNADADGDEQMSSVNSPHCDRSHLRNGNEIPEKRTMVYPASSTFLIHRPSFY